MALPLLGILGLAAAAGLKPQYDRYAQNVQGRQNQRIMEGVDMSDPAAVNQALFAGGALSGAEFQGDIRDSFEAQQQRANALQRARISAGPSYARLAFDRQRYADEQRHTAQVRENENAALAQAGIDPTSPLAGVPSVRNQILDAAGTNQITQMQQDAYAADPRPRNVNEDIALQNAEAQRQAASDEAFAAEQQRNAEFFAIDAQNQSALAELDESIRLVPNLGFDRTNWETQDERESAIVVNRTLDKLRSSFWVEELRRSDAPSEREAAALLDAFPAVEPTVWDAKKRSDLNFILNLARKRAGDKATRDWEVYNRGGMPGG